MLYVATEVSGVHWGNGGEHTRHRGIDRNTRRPGRDRSDCRHQLGRERAHLRAVEGVIHRQRAMRDAAPIQHGERRGECLVLAREHHATRAVHGANREGIAVFAHQLLRFALAEAHSSHGAQPRRLLHDARAMIDDAHGIFECERAGHMQRGDFADAVSYNRVRLEAPVLPQSGKCHLNRKDGRLRDLRFVQARRRLGRRQLCEQRPGGVLFELRVDVGKHVAKHAVARGQLAAHAEPLRPLPTEHECQARGPRGG